MRSDRSAGHIVTFAETLNGGGVERVMLRLARGWLAQRRCVTILIGTRGGPLEAEIPAGAGLIEIGRGGFPALRPPCALLARLDPDLLFCPGSHYTSTMLGCRLAGVRAPIVAKISNALARRNWPALVAWGNRRWLRSQPRFIDHFVAMTPAMAAQAERALGIGPPRLSVIANPPVIAPAQAGAALAVPLPAGPLLVGVGRLEPQKRWDRLIGAIPALAARAVRLVIVGEGSARAMLEAQIAALGLGDRVVLAGYAADPSPWLRRATAAVLTSDFEGVPNVLREALALGTPVVATDSSVAVREIVASPAQGSVVPLGDDAALVAALDYWLAAGRARPEPVPPVGIDAPERYLALFDAVVQAQPAGLTRSGWAAAKPGSACAAASAATSLG